MSIYNVADFKSKFRVANLIFISIWFADVISTWVLSRTVLKQFLQSTIVIPLNSFFDENCHSELLGNNDFICANSSVARNNTTTEFTCLFTHDFASNSTFFTTKQRLE